MDIKTAHSVPGYATRGRSVKADQEGPDRRQAEEAAKSILRRSAAGYDLIIRYSRRFEQVPGSDRVTCHANALAVKRETK
jgi:hypothetical protein